MLDSPREVAVEVDEALAAWRARPAQVSLLLGEPDRLERAAERLAASGCAVCSLGDELLARCRDVDALVSAELALAPTGTGRTSDPLAWQAHRGTVRRRLHEAFEAWLATAAGGGAPLAVRDLELAAGERLPLERLTELQRPLLLLLCARRDAAGAVHFGGGNGASLRLPPALVRAGATFELSPAASGPP